MVRRGSNGGFGAAVNSGAAAATGDWLLIANSDLRIDPPVLENLLEQARPLMPAVVGPRRSTHKVGPSTQAGASRRLGHLAVTTALPLQRFERRDWFLRLAGYVIPRGYAPCARRLAPRILPPPSPRRVRRDRRLRRELLHVLRGGRPPAAPEGRRRHAWLLPDLVVTHAGGASTIGIVDVGERMMSSRLLYASKFGGEQSSRRTLKAVAVLNLGCRLCSAPSDGIRLPVTRGSASGDAPPSPLESAAPHDRLLRPTLPLRLGLDQRDGAAAGGVVRGPPHHHRR